MKKIKKIKNKNQHQGKCRLQDLEDGVCQDLEDGVCQGCIRQVRYIK